MNKKLSAFLILALSVFALYSQTAGHGYIQVDDPKHVFENPVMHNPSWESFWGFWQKPFFNLYIPVIYSYWQGLSLLSLSPALFHLMNVVIHFFSSFLVYLLFLKFFPKRTPNAQWGALVAALVFALHPVQVEAVSWISGAKDLLSGMFALASLLVLEKSFSEKTWNRRQYFLATILFISALLSKPGVVVLPLVALILFWDRQSLKRSRYLPIGFWILFSLPIAFVTKSVQPDAQVQSWVPFWQRPWIFLDALGFYISKILVPYPLIIDYGRSPVQVMSKGLANFYPYVGLSFLVYVIERMGRIVKGTRSDDLVGTLALLFLITLLPTLGLIPFQFQLFSTVSDHYLYFSFCFAAGLVAYAFISLSCLYKRRAVILGTFTLGIWITLSFVQASFWKNDPGILGWTIQNNPKSFLAHNNLAFLYYYQRNIHGAIAHFRETVALRPETAPLRMNLAASLAAGGLVKEAIQEFKITLEKDPKLTPAWIQLGMLYVSQNMKKEAMDCLQKATALDPENPKLPFLLKAAENLFDNSRITG